MGTNRIKSNSMSQRDELVTELMKTVRNSAMRGNVKVQGCLVVYPEGEPPMPMNICAQPGGGYMVWYIEGGNAKIVALVNEKMKEVAVIPLDEQDRFQEYLSELAKEMGEDIPGQ